MFNAENLALKSGVFYCLLIFPSDDLYPPCAGFFMRRKNTKYIVVHCSATPAHRKIGVAEIRNWHKERGWRDIGYHVVITRSGFIEFGRDLDEQGAHVYGHNHNSIGVCLIGGVDEHGKAQNNFTPEQFKSLRLVILALQARYVNAQVMGHRDFPEVAKDCPSFDVREWFKNCD